MINVVTILFESITTWLCLHIVFGKKIEKRWLEVGFSGVYVPLAVLCSYKVLNKFFIIFIVVWAVIWAKKMFDEKMKKTMIKSCLSVILLGVIETIVMFLFYFVMEDIENARIKCMLMCIFSFTIVFLLYCKFIAEKSGDSRLRITRSVVVFTMIVFLFLICIKIEFENQKQVNNIYFFFFVILAIAFIYIFKEQKFVYELEKKNLNLQLQNMYGKTYEELLCMVRARQHDYKNQLIAIQSMHLSANSLDDLSYMQKKYLSILDEESKYDGILLGCNNPIIAGYLYTLCMRYLKENIIIDYNINVVSNEIDVKTKEVIEVLGVLISNAVEYNTQNDPLSKINLIIKETNNIFTIEVENKAEYMSYSLLDNIFKIGYSTKGDGRGMGLYSVKNIVDKFKGNIMVDNVTKNDENWIKFCVVI